jgi:hypothetical protein
MESKLKGIPLHPVFGETQAETLHAAESRLDVDGNIDGLNIAERLELAAGKAIAVFIGDSLRELGDAMAAVGISAALSVSAEFIVDGETGEAIVAVEVTPLTE